MNSYDDINKVDDMVCVEGGESGGDGDSVDWPRSFLFFKFNNYYNQ